MSWKVYSNISHYSGFHKKSKASSYSDYIMRDEECEAVYKNNNTIRGKENIRDERIESKKEWTNHLQHETTTNARLQTRIVIPIPNDLSNKAKEDLAREIRKTIEHKKRNDKLEELEKKQKDIKKEANKINMQIKRNDSKKNNKLTPQEIAKKEDEKKQLNLKSKELAREIRSEKKNQGRETKRDILCDIVEHKGDSKSNNPKEQNRHFHVVFSDRDRATLKKDREFQSKEFNEDIKKSCAKVLEKYNYETKIHNENGRDRLSISDYEKNKELDRQEQQIRNDYKDIQPVKKHFEKEIQKDKLEEQRTKQVEEQKEPSYMDKIMNKFKASESKEEKTKMESIKEKMLKAQQEKEQEKEQSQDKFTRQKSR